MSGDLDAVARWVAEARHAVALTGAGISVESGIPDFRSAGGLWSVFDPMVYATYSCFMRTPEKSWDLFRAIGGTLAGKKPNAAHSALARLERAGALGAVITQNIDGLHQAAGSTNVLEIHGNHDDVHCPACGHVEPMTARHLEPGPVPRCVSCGGALKPTVVLFEEPVRSLGPIGDVLSTCDVLLVVGTSAEVTPASHFPVSVGMRGGRIIEMNIEPTRLQSGSTWEGAFVQGPASVTVPRVVDRALELQDGGVA
ncbi:MAG: NAD-dependent deacylase [Acidobacteriota bacterium]|nr:NAD-dependent deacylase [Acidobacteriota bacterium]